MQKILIVGSKIGKQYGIILKWLEFNVTNLVSLATGQFINDIGYFQLLPTVQGQYDRLLKSNV